MKVLRDGKEVRSAQVIYDAAGKPALVRVEGVNFNTEGYTFQDEKSEKKTRQASETKKNDGVMTTKDLGKK